MSSKFCMVRIRMGSIFLFALMISLGCSVNQNRSFGGKYVEDFYVGEEGTQYFIKPLSFFNDKEKILLLDFTFRYKDEVKDSAVINFSIIDEKLYRRVDVISFRSNNEDISSKKIELIYNEKVKSGFLSRFTTKIPLQELDKIFESSNWTIKAIVDGESKLYNMPKKTQKTVEKITASLFVIFD